MCKYFKYSNVNKRSNKVNYVRLLISNFAFLSLKLEICKNKLLKIRIAQLMKIIV